MPSVLVSVIIPTYGRPEYLSEAITSVLEQTHRPIEVIVVDDCSPHPVELPGDADLVKLVRHARNMGPGAARNSGLAHASGEFILFLDDDDTLAPERIAIGVSAIAEMRMHACASNVPSPRFEGDMRRTLAQGLPPHLSQVLFRRSDVVQFDPTLRVTEDVEWWLRMRDRAEFAWSDIEGFRFRHHDGERHGVDPAVRVACRGALLDRHLRELDRRAKAFHLNRAASAELVAGRRARVSWLASRSLMAFPTLFGVKLLVRGVIGG